jgi:pyridoxamine 5'-phosphate oxidase
MIQKIADLRVSYDTAPFSEETIEKDPIQLFSNWFQAAVTADILEPNAMTLATADKDGRPSARMVLLKGFDNSGFVFYTNYSSNKAEQLRQNPLASLVFWWDIFARQIRIEGRVAKLSDEESDVYFNSRPRGSQLGAHTSNQSESIPDYEYLETRFAEISKQFKGQDIPRPEFWGGFRLVPEVIEFWQGRPNRLHDRLRFSKQHSGNWTMERLSP